jgi:hypothetical protein
MGCFLLDGGLSRVRRIGSAFAESLTRERAVPTTRACDTLEP